MIPSDEQIRQGLAVLAAVEKLQAEKPDIAEWEIVQEVADSLRIGEWGTERLLEIGRSQRSIEAARVEYLDKR
jgi:endonuclease YncB( thermonuclease family)